MKKILYFILFIVLLLSVSISTQATTKLSDVAVFNSIENDSVTEYDRLVSKVYDENTQSYLDYYGGAYIGVDDELVVNVTVLNDQIRKDIITFTGNNEVIINLVQNNLNELIETRDSMRLNRVFYLENGIEITSVALNQTNNVVYVRVLDLTPEKVSIVLERVNLNTIVFEQSKGNVITETDPILAGDDFDGVCTLGFSATRNGIDGFVSAAHCADINDTIYINGTYAGVVTRDREQDVTDILFVTKSSNFHLSNDMVNYYEINGRRLTDLPEGTTIYMYGQTNQWEGGEIVHSSIDFGDFTDFYATDQLSSPGDSGGPLVYMASFDNFHIVAVHRGRNPLDTSERVSTKYHNIEDTIDAIAVIS